jgi:hypothetical protein
MKSKNILTLITKLKDEVSDISKIDKYISRLLLLEKIFVIFSLIIGLAMLSGAISRVFGEQVPIFG